MSRIGRQPIELPAGVTVSVEPGRVAVAGPLGTLQQQVPQRMQIEQTDGTRIGRNVFDHQRTGVAAVQECTPAVRNDNLPGKSFRESGTARTFINPAACMRSFISSGPANACTDCGRYL